MSLPSSCFVAPTRRRTVVALTAVALAAGSVVVALPVEARPVNLVTNASVELDADRNGVPDGFEQAGFGTNRATWARVNDARTGSWGHRLSVTSITSGDRKLLASVSGPGVVGGHRYSLGVQYKSSVPAHLVVFTRRPGGTWTYWLTGAPSPASASWRSAALTTPVVPHGVSLGFGLALTSRGTVTTDDYSAVDLDATASTTTTASTVSTTTTTTAAVTTTVPVPAPSLLHDDFDRPDGLETNEFAFWNQSLAPASARASLWEMSSGSLFVRDGAGHTGRPDGIAPDVASSNGTNSAIFRLRSKRMDLGDVAIAFRLQNLGLTVTPQTPATAWDGVHVWLRYQSQQHLYYASVNRRDDTIVIKKKVPGGPSNGGTYTSVATGRLPVVYGRWTDVSASVVTRVDGSVVIRLWVNGALVLQGLDAGIGGVPPITVAGAVGIRGDNAELLIDDLEVRSVS
jgi:hypothetical protein